MTILLNDQSLHGQFEGLYDFLQSLRVVLDCRTELKHLNRRLHCTEEVLKCLITKETTLRDLLYKPQMRSLRGIVLSWLSKEGPFWDQPAQHDDEGTWIYFKDQDDLIIQTAMAEAAHRIEQGEQAALVSFMPSGYEENPLIVTWQEDEKETSIPNFWGVAPLREYVQSLETRPQNWPEFSARAQDRFSILTFSPTWDASLASSPFVPAAAERAMELLAILAELKQKDGRATQGGRELYDKFFVGDTARFSDESETNKRRFQQAMTFTLESDERIFCPLHGKIRSNVFRLHFSSPISQAEPLHIVYLGPKITKS